MSASRLAVGHLCPLPWTWFEKNQKKSTVVNTAQFEQTQIQKGGIMKKLIAHSHLLGLVRIVLGMVTPHILRLTLQHGFAEIDDDLKEETIRARHGLDLLKENWIKHHNTELLQSCQDDLMMCHPLSKINLNALLMKLKSLTRFVDKNCAELIQNQR